MNIHPSGLPTRRVGGLGWWRRLALVLGVGWTFSVTVSLCAPEEGVLRVGEWSGTYRLSGNDQVDATFSVDKLEESGDWSIVMVLQMGRSGEFTYPLQNIEVEDDGLRFTFQVGETTKNCSLERNDAGELHGDCKGEEGNARTVHIVMLPPVSETEDGDPEP